MSVCSIKEQKLQKTRLHFCYRSEIPAPMSWIWINGFDSVIHLKKLDTNDMLRDVSTFNESMAQMLFNHNSGVWIELGGAGENFDDKHGKQTVKVNLQIKELNGSVLNFKFSLSL